VSEPLYMLILASSPLIDDSPNDECEVWFGSKADMTKKYDEALAEDEGGYTNIVLSRIVLEAQLTYEQIEYGDDE